MKRWMIYWSALIATGAVAQDVGPVSQPLPIPVGGEEESDGRIVGGSPAFPGTVKWQVEFYSAGRDEWTPREIALDRGLIDSDQTKMFLHLKPKWERNHRCGGALIPGVPGKPGIWVLTAAHCVTLLEPDRLSLRRVRLGTQDLTSGGRSYAIERVAIHEGYGADRAHDIALVRLAGSLPSTAKPIRMIDKPLAPNNRVVVTGWGLTTAFRPGERIRTQRGTLLRGSPVLMEVALLVFPDEECRRFAAFKAPMASGGGLCAGSPVAGKDACPGDSGGPVTKVEGNEVRLAGFVSLGLGCGQRAPGVYVKLSEYRGWIDKAMKVARSGQVTRVAPPL